MEGNYNLEWLDLAINVTLNPSKINLSQIPAEQINHWQTKIEEEKVKCELQLIKDIFSLLDDDKINILVNQYHSTLIILLNQAYENKKKLSPVNKDLKSFYDSLINSIENLLDFIELRFSEYLSLNKRISAARLSQIKKELKEKTGKLKEELRDAAADEQLAAIILNELNSFINGLASGTLVTLQRILYFKELIEELEHATQLPEMYSASAEVQKILINLNFNSRAYVNHFTKKIAEELNKLDYTAERLERLLLYHKNFNQISVRPGAVLNPQFNDLKIMLGSWFAQEIFYLEKKLHLAVIPTDIKNENVKPIKEVEKDKPKVLCILSTDQMSLIFRAADELKILIARSLNEVFKTIVPSLSTPYKENLSPDSMRSKSYSAEERDKEIVIQTLEHMIKKIREY